jgi:hypothetical protein
MADARLSIEFKIADVPLGSKLDALAAALVCVREAHRDTMSPRTWEAINRALDALAAATIYSSGGGPRLAQPKEVLCGRRNAPAYHQHTTPAEGVVSLAGNVGAPR